MATINTLKSEVELNRKLIVRNDVLFYTDNANCQKWTVTELFDGGFEAKDEFETRDFYFEELQLGWSISAVTKKFHLENNRFHYN